MNKTNKILISIIIVLSFLIALFYNTYLKDKADTNENTKATLIVEEYNVYDYSDVDFRFIITKLKIESKDDLEIQLNELKVNGETLEDSRSYIKELKDKNYQLDVFDEIDNVIIKDNNNDSVTLFIPITDDVFNVATLSSKYFEDVIFDLRENLIVNEDKDEPTTDEETPDVDEEVEENPDDEDESETGNNDFGFNEDQAVVKKGFEIKVETAFTTLNYNYSVNGENYNSSSNEVLHAIPVRLISKDGATYEITEAKFIYNNKEIIAKPASFKTMDLESILNKKTNTQQDGALMFVTYSQSSEPISYKGKILIRVNNGEWIELEVVI